MIGWRGRRFIDLRGASERLPSRARRLTTVSLMAVLRRVAPIFPVRDLSASLAHHERLGFATRAYEGGGYAYATRDGVEIHLGVVPDATPSRPIHTAARQASGRHVLH